MLLRRNSENTERTFGEVCSVHALRQCFVLGSSQTAGLSDLPSHRQKRKGRKLGMTSSSDALRTSLMPAGKSYMYARKNSSSREDHLPLELRGRCPLVTGDASCIFQIVAAHLRLTGFSSPHPHAQLPLRLDGFDVSNHVRRGLFVL